MQRASLSRAFVTLSSLRSSAQTTTQPAKALQALALQSQHYAKVRIDGKAYTVTQGDVVHLPTRLKDTSVGDSLRLTHAMMIGSRDFTIRGAPYVKDDLFECFATVVEHTKQPMLRTIKKKRRNRHAKLIESKQPYTVIRISSLQMNDKVPVEQPTI